MANRGASQAWVDSGYYPRSNPSGYATGVDGSLYVRRTESGQFVTTGQTGAFYPRNNPSGFVTGNYYPLSNPSGYASSGQLVRFSTLLNSGVESQSISYPATLAQKPNSISCEIENNQDNLIYSHVVGSVSSNGFSIYFSDYLSSTGYTLYTTLII